MPNFYLQCAIVSLCEEESNRYCFNICKMLYRQTLKCCGDKCFPDRTDCWKSVVLPSVNLQAVKI